MSAITGIYNLNNEPIVLSHCVYLMKDLAQFPSDDIHTWKNQSIFFGCHNQWITPESANARIPYYDNERQLVITADAIIDNRHELFERLQVSHHQRKNITDSELILLAYLKWEKESPKYLIGDFAFMIWDGKKKILFGARDFSGARTLYYFKDHLHFAFCTIMEPLFKLPYIKKKLNEEWLAEFLAIPTIVEGADIHNTVYENIYQLPPAHTITLENSRISLKRYWSFGSIETSKLKSDGEYKEAFEDIFNTAVTEKLRTNGKVGSHLSGGLDSGTVASFAAKTLKEENKQLHTYSYIPEANFIDWTPKYYAADERPYIKETINYIGNIESQFLDFAGKSPLEEVDNFLDIMEMPYKFFENAFWLKGINETAHNDGVKILLNGARGNHSISWGTWQLNMDYYASLFKKLKLFQLNRELDLYCKNFKTGKRVMLPAVAKKAFPAIASRLSVEKISDYHFPIYINPAFAEKTNIFNKLHQNKIDISGAFHGDFNEYRKNHYEHLYFWNKSGTATTKLSLRYSLWDRDPTNDLRVIRFCLSIPQEQYVRHGMERSFLRRVTKNLLPDTVRLNHYVRGIQGADTIYRMRTKWPGFLNELDLLMKDSFMSEILNIEVLKNAITYIKEKSEPNIVWSDEFKIATRSLIIFRFLKNMN